MKRILPAVLLLMAATSLLAQSDSTAARTAFLEGRSAMTARQTDAAIAAFQRAIALDSTNADYHLWLGYSYVREIKTANFMRQPFIGRRIGAEYDKAVALAPLSIEAAEARVDFYLDAPSIVGGGTGKAKAEAARIRTLNAYRGGLAQAKVDEKSGDAAGAEAEYRELMRVFPDSVLPATKLQALAARKK